MQTSGAPTRPNVAVRPGLATVGVLVGTFAPFAVTGLAYAAVDARFAVGVPILPVLVGLFALRAFNGFAVSAVLHRWGAHAGVWLWPPLRDALRIWAWLWTGLGVRTWAAVHRRHHAEPDGPDALFTPSGPRGFLAIGPMTLRTHWEAIRDPEPWARFVRDLPDDALERFIRGEERRLFGILGIRVPLLVGLHVLPWMLVAPPATAALLGVCTLPATVGAVTSGAVWLVNGLGHTAGWRPHATPDTSTNIARIDVWLMGEGLHNNHHARPADPNFAHAPGEFDPTYAALRVLEAVGAARLERRAG
ncbi:MAG: fatty acid desaturase [Alphaproteobacteria bacterium]|nr:fatty acid desaturase [Alphaproteobacteria bacterium]